MCSCGSQMVFTSITRERVMLMMLAAYLCRNPPNELLLGVREDIDYRWHTG